MSVTPDRDLGHEPLPAGPPPQFPVLDTLRFVGALAVLTTHTSFWAGAYTGHAHWGGLLARLDVGVAIFFVLSGFLLSRPWIASSRARTSTPDVRRYFWKRVLRIVPLYVVTAVLALAFIEENEDLDVRDWVVTLLLANIYVDERLPAGLTQMWSLSTEVAFYLVLPLLMLLALGRGRQLRPRRVLLMAVAMAATSVAWLGGDLSGLVADAEHRAVNEWLPAFLGWFAVGILLALAQVVREGGGLPGRLDRTVDQLARAPGACWVAVFGLLLVATTPLAGPTLLVAPTPSEALTKNLIYAVIGGIIVFTGVFAAPDSRYARVMSQPWLRHLGHISYGIFCIHLPMLHLVMWSTGYQLFAGHLWQIFTLTLVASILAAELLHRFVEKPCMGLRDVGWGSMARAKPTPRANSTR